MELDLPKDSINCIATGMMTRSGSPRVPALDTLRLLAALAVVYEHVNSVQPVLILPWPLSGLLNAYSAVSLFFVLSGYVLHLSFCRRDLTIREWSSFTIKRVFRLYPLHLAVLVLAASVVWLVPWQESSWLLESTYTHETLAAHNHRDTLQWLHQASLVSGAMDSTFVNPPIWTLAAEMRISLIFPLMAVVLARTNRFVASGMVLMSLLSCPWLASHTIATVGMIPLFLLGALTAKCSHSSSHAPRAHAWMLALGAGLYSLAGSLGGLGFGHLGPYYVAGVGAAFVIAALARCGAALPALLIHPIVLRFSQCSYGIYLLHFPLLVIVTWAVQRYSAPANAILPCLLTITIPLSRMLHQMIERPCIAWGARIALRIASPAGPNVQRT